VTVILAASDERLREQVRGLLLEAGCNDVRVADTASALSTMLLESARTQSRVVLIGGKWPEPGPLLRAGVASGAPVVMLLSAGTAESERETLAGGARAALRSDIPAASLTAALAAVHAGLIVVDRPEAMHDSRAPRHSETRRIARQLTSRERQILSFVASGTSNKGIARALGVSANTVKFHLAAAFEKLNTSTRAEAVAEAIRRGELSV